MGFFSLCPRKNLSGIRFLLLSSGNYLRTFCCCFFVHFILFYFSGNKTAIFTTRKRILGQGNIFTPVCSQGGVCSLGRGALSRERSVPGRGGLVGGGLVLEGCLVETPPGRLLLRAVLILLECILVHT